MGGRRLSWRTTWMQWGEGGPAAILHLMLIGLIADTHIPEAGPDIWPQVYMRFREEKVDAKY